jgi:hypothetical protein
MPEDNTALDSNELYALQRQVELLRQQALYPVNSGQAETLLDALLEAEQRLAQQEALRPNPPPGGLLLDNRAPAASAGGQLMGPQTTGLEVSVQLRLERLPTAIVHLLERQDHPLVSFELHYSGGEYIRLRVSSRVEGYSAEAVDTVELTYQARTAVVHQLPTFFPERLRQVTELTPATLHVRVENLDGGLELHSTHRLQLLARSSAYQMIRDPATGKMRDLRPYLAAWVTPNVPEVMELLRQAAELHPERRIVGYQTDPDGVRAQVQAVYAALQAQELTYINSLASFGAEAGAHIQRIRLPREALQYRSANCIDGTLLMASVLEFASLHAGLVLVPGHAFLAWESTREGGDPEARWDYLETTMIGSSDFEAANARGRQLAVHYRKQAARPGMSHHFYLLSLLEARSRLGIYPME